VVRVLPNQHHEVVGAITLTLPGSTTLGPILIRSFQLQGTPVRLGVGGERENFSAITFTRVIDSLSPTLFQDASTGRGFPSAALDIYAEGTADVVLRYNLTDVTISSFGESNDGQPDGVPLETITLGFARLTVDAGATAVAP
jgi:type VI protein secretion system component Hcp